MKKLVLAVVGLFMMAGFLPAKEQASGSHIECFHTTCGETACGDYGRELTNEERYHEYLKFERILCEEGETPGETEIG